ncbi:TetR/AcrR family transcriptional regulator [Gordonia aichiensis]|uniref:Putative TetR family transcriptional regulator n=1 Tax=Gordonia aichiensis NBRC 108223 TaxID=1220583 RepID=L7KLP3_9ACTN|nr:TetR/AcrR family transcriptional regulator [Gordonia aichiensis]GAC49519.1 putative TetR family transcriptional regulator [Gordonia aichiensis NBRC 108223]
MSRAPVKRRTRSRARILESVETVLESGVRYADVPVERILTSANVSRSTFYQWFDDKGDLIENAAEPFFTAFWAVSDTWWMRTQPLGPDDLADIITRMFELGRKHGPVWRAFLETVDVDSRLRAEFDGFLKVYTAKMAERLRRDQQEGLAPADMDPEQTARFITVTTRGSLLDLINAPEEFDAQFAEALADGFWAAMYGTLPGPEEPADQSNSIATDSDDGVA